MRRFKRTDISPSQSRYLIRSSMFLKIGLGGLASDTALDKANRTESARASSFWLPASTSDTLQKLSTTVLISRKKKRAEINFTFNYFAEEGMCVLLSIKFIARERALTYHQTLHLRGG